MKQEYKKFDTYIKSGAKKRQLIRKQKSDIHKRRYSKKQSERLLFEEYFIT